MPYREARYDSLTHTKGISVYKEPISLYISITTVLIALSSIHRDQLISSAYL
jgi:hypothetical protein